MGGGGGVWPSITKGLLGVKFMVKKHYVTLEWPLRMWSPRQVTHLPPCGIFYFPLRWHSHRHQIEGTNSF